MQLDRHPENPILKPVEANPWESFSVCNPGVVYDDATGIYHMLYRGGDSDEAYTRCLGHATSTDGVHFQRSSTEPVMRPLPDNWDGGALEDPRIIKMGDWYYITYVAFGRAQGQVWKPKSEWKPAPEFPDFFPSALKYNITAVGLALTQDFKTFRRLGTITDRAVNNRNCVLFPVRIRNQWWRLHRPTFHGQGPWPEKPSIWITHSNEVLSWDAANESVLMEGREPWESKKIGANTPPVLTDLGWLFIYHGVDENWHYRLGAAILDKENPGRVLYRTREPLLEPTEPYELEGLHDSALFPCGSVLKDGLFRVYYGAADKCIGLATCPIDRLLNHLSTTPE